MSGGRGPLWYARKDVIRHHIATVLKHKLVTIQDQYKPTEDTGQ